jgi:threonine dehydrogenase-like Zn-dependent dehydrogenase
LLDEARVQQLTFIRPGVVKWREIAEPRLEQPTDVVVRPVAVATCDLDAAVLRGAVPVEGEMKLGHEFVGEVIDVGSEVGGVQLGDRYCIPFQICCGDCARCRRGLTGDCERAPVRAMFGLSGFGGGDWGGALSDAVRVPFARNMLVPVPEGIDAATGASASDNLPDAYRTVAGPLLEQPGAPVLVIGGGGATGSGVRACAATSVGLYACQFARALGSSSVTYFDHDDGRLELAEKLGAEPIEARDPGQEGRGVVRFPRRLDPQPIVVDASGHPDGLALALRSTDPGGVCTSAAIYFELRTPIPLLEMYGAGITFRTGRTHARRHMPEVMELVASGAVDPGLITSEIIDWHRAPEALADPPAKLVIKRGADDHER